MSANPAIQSIAGRGKPRILVTTDLIFFGSTDATYSATGLTVGVSADLSPIRAGMRVSSTTAIAGQPDKPTYGKVTSVDDMADVITVDAWTPTIPTNGKIWTVDGWVVDLPYCKEMTETFTPDQIIHKLYRKRLDSQFYGWEYAIALDYSNYIAPDTLIDARHILSADTNRAMAILPHVDKPGFAYNVVFDQAVSVSRFGRSPGYKKAVLSFRGKETLASWPINASGYGYGYASDYGNQL